VAGGSEWLTSRVRDRDLVKKEALDLKVHWIVFDADGYVGLGPTDP
jgi:hypothetical protein